MLSSLLTSPCELKLHLLQHVVFLRPPTSRPTEDALPTSNDEVARGLVELYVPTDRRIDGIRVKLRAVQSVAVLPDQRDMIAFAGATPIAWEDTVLMEKIVEIGVPPSRSHATVPGDDSIANTERRGRSRLSRNATPSGSRPGSPSRESPSTLADEPPIYEETESEERVNRHERTDNGQQTPTPGALGAVIRAFSRGRPHSRSASRPGSRTPSRVGSRTTSPARERDRSNSQNADGAGPSSATESPGLELDPRVSTTSPSQSRQDSGLPAIRRADSDETTARGTESNGEIVTLAGHFSRTGLSMGRSNASGPHPHASDQADHFGVGNTSAASGGMRGRGGYGNSSAAAGRSMTVSPSRGFARDESRPRLAGLGKRNARAPSADVATDRSVSRGRSAGDKQSGLFLQKGVHGFEFAFILPADSPPYERSPFGRVRYVVKATAFGAGRAKSNLETWQDMFPVVNPSSDGGPMPLAVLYNDVHSTVGMLSVACTSNNISVGGIFSVDIHSPNPPPDLIVYLVRVSVETSIELRTRKKRKQHVPTQRHKLFEKGWVPPRANDPLGHGDGKKSEGIIRDPNRPGSRADDAWTVQGVARMPNDNIVRSTTHPRTRAAIRFSHQLLVEVVHSRQPSDPSEERKIKVFALRQPISLPSCCVAFDAVTLPAYTASDENARSAAMPYDIEQPGDTMHPIDREGQRMTLANTPDEGSLSATRAASRTRTSTAARLTGPGHELCVCGQTIADLSNRERELMPARPVGELPLDGLSHRKIGELPTRDRGNGSGSDSISGIAGLGQALQRHTSRSSSTSRESRVTLGERSASIGRRSLSIARNMSRARSPSAGSSASARGRRAAPSGSVRSPSTSSSRTRPTSESQRFAGMPLPGTGERGEGVIRTGRRQSIPAGVVGASEASPAQSRLANSHDQPLTGNGTASLPPSYESAVDTHEETSEQTEER